MFPRLFYNNFRRLKLHPLPKCSSILLSAHNNTFIRSIPLQQNIANFSLSASVTTKKSGPFKTKIKKQTANLTTEIDRVEQNVHNEETYLQSLNDPDTYNSKRDDVFLKESIDAGYIENFNKSPISRDDKPNEERYVYMIKKHLNKHHLQKAIDVLEIQMIGKDGMKPTTYIYNLLISGCASKGAYNKAFDLFSKMQQRGVKVSGATYTSLFNACSAGPWPQERLSKARRLREIMQENGYGPNTSNYNAMIKAFGRCRDITTAFQLVEEVMESKYFDIRVGTFNILLQACISDGSCGFRYALLVWHKMYRQQCLVPDLYSFNLMVRCVRDCSIGDVEAMQQVMSGILIESKLDDDKQLKIADKQLLIESENDSDRTQTAEWNEIVDDAPNLITRFPHLGTSVGLSEVRTAEDRLSLLGGAAGILNEMKELKVQPDVKTFTLLLDVIPSTNTAEDEIIEMIREQNVRCDIGFFNTLIKRRSMRQAYDDAKSTLKVIKLAGLKPDIVTYTTLAVGCRNIEEARELIAEVDHEGMRLHVLEIMLKQGCSRYDFPYIIEIMNITSEGELKPNKQFLAELIGFNEDCHNVLKTSNDNPVRTAEFEAGFDNFKLEFENWKDFIESG